MSDYTIYSIAGCTLDSFRKQLERVLEDSGIDETSRMHVGVSNVIHQIKMVGSTCYQVPLEIMPGTTKMDLINELNPNFTYDTALPQMFLDDVHKVTGQYIPQHLIWDVDNDRPVALSTTGKTVLAIYSHITGMYNESMDK